jgi:PHP family Zn ribbon phosphoesterase
LDKNQAPFHAEGQAPPRFVPTGEISTIYRRDGRARKVHHLILFPGLEAAAAFQARLEKAGGNIRSDAHSPNKLGREATIFEMDPSYSALAEALAGASRTAAPGPAVLETVEFFPQEGKYHYDGHRNCGVSRSPVEAAAAAPCPVCGKPLTPGVLGRVRRLADRPVSEDAPCPSNPAARGNRRPYRSLIPLAEI